MVCAVRVVSLCPSVCGIFRSARSMSCLFVCRVRVFLCPWLSPSLSFFCVSLPVSASFVIFLFVCVGLFVPVSSAVVPPFVCRLLCVRVVCRRPLFVRGLSFPPFLRSFPFPFLLSSPPVSVSPVFVSRSVRALPLSVSLVSFRRPRRRGACPSCETVRLFRLRPPKSRIRSSVSATTVRSPPLRIRAAAFSASRDPRIARRGSKKLFSPKTRRIFLPFFLRSFSPNLSLPGQKYCAPGRPNVEELRHFFLWSCSPNRRIKLEMFLTCIAIGVWVPIVLLEPIHYFNFFYNVCRRIFNSADKKTGVLASISAGFSAEKTRGRADRHASPNAEKPTI